MRTSFVLLARRRSSRGRRGVAAGARPPAERRSLEYAADTWHSFDMMLYPATGLPPTTSRPRASGPLHVADQHRRLPLEHARRPRPRDHHGRRGRARIAQTLDTLATLERHEASGQFYNWYDPQTGAEAHDVAGRRQHRLPVPLQRRQRLARRGADDGRERRAAARATRRARSSTDMDFGFYYDPAPGLIRGGSWREPPPGCSVSTTTAARPDVYYTCHHYGALNTEPRIASYIGIAAARSRHALLQDVAHVPRHLRLGLAGDEARGRHAHLPRRRRLRGPLHLPRHEHRPELGRLDVRGADGAAARPRGGVGAAELGRQPPALRRRRRSSTAWRRPSTATGASRPRTTPTAATASTASTRSASSRTATPPTRSGRSSTTASRAAGRRAAADGYGRGVVTPHASFLALDFDRDAGAREPRPSCARTSTPTARAASTTRSTSSPARSRATTSRSTRG